MYIQLCFTSDNTTNKSTHVTNHEGLPPFCEILPDESSSERFCPESIFSASRPSYCSRVQFICHLHAAASWEAVSYGKFLSQRGKT